MILAKAQKTDVVSICLPRCMILESAPPNCHYSSFTDTDWSSFKAACRRLLICVKIWHVDSLWPFLFAVLCPLQDAFSEKILLLPAASANDNTLWSFIFFFNESSGVKNIMQHRQKAYPQA